MITSADCLKKYGDPKQQNNLCVWIVPERLRVGAIPEKIYCNRDLIGPLTHAFELLIQTGAVKELKTWDGCFNIRPMRGLTEMSIHSWAMAVDVNAATNALGATPTLSSDFVGCFLKAGFDWGGYWRRKDGMHFQLAKLP